MHIGVCGSCHSGVDILMRIIYQILTLAPAPLFFIGFLWNIFSPPAICGAFPYEMALMWFIMFSAHLTPWILFWQQRDFARR
jgi:hypothetical protein